MERCLFRRGSIFFMEGTMLTEAQERVAPFMSPTVLEQWERGNRRKGEWLVTHYPSEKFHEDRTRFKPTLLLDGPSYKPFQLFDCTPVHKDDPGGLTCPTDRSILYKNVILPKGYNLEIGCNDRRGSVIFNSDVVLPTLYQGNRLWMSLTPNEFMTMRQGIDMASGTVVVGGLGLGWLLLKVCRKISVAEVIVVEKSPAILSWVGDRLKTMFPKEMEKVKGWIVGDAIRRIGRHGRGTTTTYLLDVWDEYGAAGDDQVFRAAKKKASKVWGWGDY